MQILNMIKVGASQYQIKRMACVCVWGGGGWQRHNWRWIEWNAEKSNEDKVSGLLSETTTCWCISIIWFYFHTFSNQTLHLSTVIFFFCSFTHSVGSFQYIPEKPFILDFHSAWHQRVVPVTRIISTVPMQPRTMQYQTILYHPFRVSIDLTLLLITLHTNVYVAANVQSQLMYTLAS